MFKKCYALTLVLATLGGELSLIAAAGHDMNIISNVIACGDGLISGGATIICVQTTIVQTGGREAPTLPSGASPIPGQASGARRSSNVPAAAVGVHPVSGTPANVQAIVTSPTGQQAPDKTAIITFDPVKNFTPAVNLGQIRSATQFPLYIPGASNVGPSTYLYTFTPTQGVARGQEIQVLLKVSKPDATLYQHAQPAPLRPEVPTTSETAATSAEQQPASFSTDQLDLLIYQKNPRQNTWSRIGIVSNIEQQINNPQAIMPAQLTAQPDGKIIIPQQGDKPTIIDLAELYTRGPAKSRLGHQASQKRRAAQHRRAPAAQPVDKNNSSVV